MKGYFLVLIFSGCIGACKAQINWGLDMPKHFAVGLVIGGVGGYAANKVFRGDNRWTSAEEFHETL